MAGLTFPDSHLVKSDDAAKPALTNLPLELAEHICSFVKSCCLVELRQTSRFWWDFIDDQALLRLQRLPLKEWEQIVISGEARLKATLIKQGNYLPMSKDEGYYYCCCYCKPEASL